MDNTLLSMPREVLTQMILSSDLDNFIRLWSTGDKLRDRLYTGPNIVKRLIPYTKEAKLAHEGRIDGEQALLRTHMRSEGFALARPYSVALLAEDRNEESVQYSDGVLCYMHQDMVRILDVHAASATEDVIDMKALLAELMGHDPSGIEYTGKIYRYQNGILTMKLNRGPFWDDNEIMVVIDVHRSFVSTQNPTRIRKTLRLPLPLEVITDGRYLICVHWDPEEEGDLDPRRKALQWTLKCYDLSNPDGSASIIGLGEFLPTEGCIFKLFGGWFYAHCTAREEPDTRRIHYYCCRFPIDDFGPAGSWESGHYLDDSPYTPLPARLEAIKVFRGFADDIRGEIPCAFVQDERTGEVIFSATRPKDDSKIEIRDQRIVFPNPPAHTVSSLQTTLFEIVQTIEEDHFSSDTSVHHFSSYQTKRYEDRRYVQPSRSFIDIVYEHGENGPPEQIFQLYAGSRVADSPIDPATNLLYKKEALTASNDHSIDRGIRQFPPQGAPQELRGILTAPGWFTVLSDERSLIVAIYAKENQYEDEFGRRPYRLILVNFDSGICFPGFKTLALDNISDHIDGEPDVDELRQLKVDIIQRKKASGSGTTAREAETPELHDWFSKNVPAIYLEEGQGFQFN